MSVQENEAIVRRFFKCYGTHALDDWDEFCATDLVTHQSTHPDNVGLESRKQGDLANLAAFPDLTITIKDLIARDDKVAVRFVSTGTHKGEFGGIPPTGKKASIPGMGIYRFADGRIVEEWLNVDFLGLWRQLDILPPWEELVERAKSKQA